MPRNRRYCGITLVEVLIAIITLGFGVLASVQAMNAALLATQHANRLALATTLAEAAIEDIRGSGDIVPADEQLDVPLLVNGRRTVTVTNYGATNLNLRRVTIDVTWTGRHEQTERVRLETIIAVRTRHAGG